MLNLATQTWARPRLRLPALVRRFGKFGCVGASGAAINLLLFWLLTSRAQVHYLIASALAFEVAMCSNFVLNNSWTFSDRSSGRLIWRQLSAFQVVSLGALAVNLAVVQLLAGGLSTSPLQANVVGICCGSVSNFTLNLLWTWRARPVLSYDS